MYYLETSGLIRIIPNKIIFIELLDKELFFYYRWFIKKEYWINILKPKRGLHVTLLNTKVDDFCILDWKKFEKFECQNIKVKLSNFIYEGGQTKNFINFWIKVKVPNHPIFKFLPKNNYLHMTIGNSKNAQKYANSYWPEMIKIK